MRDLSPILLASGLFRVLLWITIAIIGYQRRRLLPLAYGVLAALVASVHAVTGAHGDLPDPLEDTGALLATPVAALILASVLVTRSTVRLHRGRWLL